MGRPIKYHGKKISKKFLEHREENARDNGYPTQKWILFCKLMISYCQVELYESKSTVSKYVTLSRNKQKLKIRFSNHPANRMKEEIQDSDFYVGRTTKGVFNTQHAIDFVFKKLNLEVYL